MNLNRFSPYAAVVLRLAVGTVFLHHGWWKLHNFAAVTGMVDGIGFPFAPVFAAIVTGVETLGAVCVILGVLTRIWGLLMAVEMVVAILALLLPQGQTPELEGMLLAGALALVALGDGPLSIGVTLKKGSD
jgi:putative oxidoreductase